MQYRTLADLCALVRNNIHQIPHDIDLVVGIPRSGMLPANMIALFLNKRLTDLHSFIEGRVLESGERKQYIHDSAIRKVLVVDDSVYGGRAMSEAKDLLVPLKDKYDFVFLAPIVTSEGVAYVDLYFEVIDDTRIFEWNVFHHSILEYACLDIDGVLNLDPEIDDDGPIYTDFVKNATPLFIPTVPVGALVSCRLEKYRQYTEQWLNEHNVKYNELELLPIATKAERIKWGRHGQYKGEYYRNSNYCLFIESSKEQAYVIAEISHKPVLCVETNEMLIIPEKVTLSKRIRRKIKRIFPKLYKQLQRIYKGK